MCLSDNEQCDKNTPHNLTDAKEIKDDEGFTSIPFTYTYPDDPDFDIISILERINLDNECKWDLYTDKGFKVHHIDKIKKNIKNPDGIFSPRFGQQLTDLNPFMNRYKCECGYTEGRVFNDTVCELCKTKVKFVDDDFEYFGWIMLKEQYHLIHPNLYKVLNQFLGTKRGESLGQSSSVLSNIIQPFDKKDVNGNSIPREEYDLPKDEPFYGIGMIELVERFDEVLAFYLKKDSKKKKYYDDLIANKDKIFIHCIPVFTSLLRPYILDGNNFTFNEINSHYNMLAKLIKDINKDTLRIHRKKKPKMQLLSDAQGKLNALYKECEATLGKKTGQCRQLFSARMNFTSRQVITGSPELKTDEVRLSYYGLVKMCEQQIINILVKTYNMTQPEAYMKWYKASFQLDKIVYNIIDTLIKNHISGRGLPMLINRNPTINYGSIMQVFCIGINNDFTMSLPLNILPPLAADFDGDTLNILYIINDDFYRAANRVFNPRNAFLIDKNDGLCNMDLIHPRDFIVNANTLIRTTRIYYNEEQLSRIRVAQECMYNENI